MTKILTQKPAETLLSGKGSNEVATNCKKVAEASTASNSCLGIAGSSGNVICTAFQVTEDDIENVLEQYSMRVTDTKGKSFETMAAELVSEIDHARVEKAALKAGCDLEEQTQGALHEIKKILVDRGVLEF